ncbi:MAG: tRNA uridine-5-carboxymethylaminomethyl(34) synthesis enzyme MnmG [Alphaproteobacteria bacterium GM202ARS2]|nr:tRNA uridine-5-carboxymethylaminomethyl(34) synthesis enzyme MnmG [Alphaproteobacteria bacterium GM202ARS2]
MVVGGGHAGCEAASVAARMGVNTLLLTHDLATIGAMSCNPSIGGLGKGHLVREIDAFDGLMGRAADAAGIHFKMLNQSKGPAVQGPRAQSDRQLYRAFIMRALKRQKNLSLLQGAVGDLIIDKGHCRGVRLEDGTPIHAQSVILTTGTFLRAEIHIGTKIISGGRMGEKAALKLANTLHNHGLPLRRLKTGTPPRIDATTIATNKMTRQDPDTQPTPFSPLTQTIQQQVPCYITATNPHTHKLVKDAIHLSPLHFNTPPPPHNVSRETSRVTSRVTAPGPRYCPSLEDKVMRFSTKDHHQIFIEPEGLNSPLIYPNGLSLSLPESVQDAVIRSIKGLENARITTYGYCIDYDCADSRAIDHQLQTRIIKNLYFAGQINGTTGYEEAAAQGLYAGIQASLALQGRPPLTIDRAQAYIGVMVDDLTRYTLSEPYRMLTSRAEYRLRLRADNAEERLTPLALHVGCISTPRLRYVRARQRLKQSVRDHLARHPELPALARQNRLTPQDILARVPSLRGTPPPILQSFISDWRYQPYMQRQENDIRAMRQDDQMPLPDNTDYTRLGFLSNECASLLDRFRPPTLGAAARLPGMTPAALIALMRYSKTHDKKHHKKHPPSHRP